MVGLILSVVISLRLVPVDTLKGFIKWIDIDTTNDSIRWALTQSWNDVFVYRDGEEYRRFRPESYEGNRKMWSWVVDSIILTSYEDTSDILGYGFYFTDRYGNRYREISLREILRPYYEEGYTWVRDTDTLWGKFTGLSGIGFSDTQFIRYIFHFYDSNRWDEDYEWGGFGRVWWIDLINRRVIKDRTFPLFNAHDDRYIRSGDTIYMLGRDMYLYRYTVKPDGSFREEWKVSTPYLAYAGTDSAYQIEISMSVNSKYLYVSCILGNPETFALYRSDSGRLIGFYTKDSFGMNTTSYSKGGIVGEFPHSEISTGIIVIGKEVDEGNFKRALYYNIDSMKVMNVLDIEGENNNWSILTGYPLDPVGREVVYYVAPDNVDSIYLIYVNEEGEREIIRSDSSVVYIPEIKGFYKDRIKYLSVMHGSLSVIYKIIR